METPKESIFKKPWVQSLTGIFSVLIIVSSVLFYKYISSHINIDNAVVSSPVISISPESTGILEEIYVRVGDNVTAGQTIGRIGAQILSTKVAGTIIEVTNTPGQVFSPSQSVVKMIDPREFRIIGTIKENDGLSDVKIGNPVSFTVDAFGSKTYTGIVESITPTSKQSGVAFSISDKREIKEFEINVKYDITINREFKNGMSARMKIYK